ncbi:hypothetical protein KR222_006073 [Zaprionus bogoriensis]|nr:hypothetical protein KR222_006073 [Zaprionus bogoriensis]
MASTSALKAFAYFLHVLCTLLSLVLISFGIYIYASYDLNGDGEAMSIAYVIVGAAGIFIFLWGSLSAWRENVCCTVTFVTILVLVILGQVAVMYLLTSELGAIASTFTNTLDVTWEEELKNPGAMALYENWFKCCGRGSPQDYIVNQRLPPATCFENHDKSNPDSLIHKGCRIEFENYWRSLLESFNIVGWVLIGIELVLCFVSCGLCNSIRNDRRRTYF